MAFAAGYRQRTVLKMEDHELQSFNYYLDESDPDIVDEGGPTFRKERLTDVKAIPREVVGPHPLM